jgi:molybdenum-dependent DNA-binding transcriptional regulator ModE
MQKASKDMLTIEQLKEDGGKNGGSCSLSEASIRMMDTIEKMQKLMENGPFPEIFQQKLNRMEIILFLLSLTMVKHFT